MALFAVLVLVIGRILYIKVSLASFDVINKPIKRCQLSIDSFQIQKIFQKFF